MGFGVGDNFVFGDLAAEVAEAASVDEFKAVAVVFGFGADAVAGDADLFVNYADAAADEAVEECGLADVGAAYDGYGSIDWVF